MTLDSTVRVVHIALSILALAACSRNLDSVMWECQLEVQKSNAGKSAEAAAERAHDIEACMEARGYPFDDANPSCEHGSVKLTCYHAK